MATAAAYRVRNSTIFAAPASVRTLLNVIAPAGHGLSLTEFGISFDGVTASAVPCFIELCTSTQGVTGTPVAGAVGQVRGRTTTGQAPTVGTNYTVEPQTLVSLCSWYVSPNGGTFIYPLPLGREIECDSSGGTLRALALRITPTATVNVTAYMEVEALG